MLRMHASRQACTYGPECKSHYPRPVHALRRYYETLVAAGTEQLRNTRRSGCSSSSQHRYRMDRATVDLHALLDRIAADARQQLGAIDRFHVRVELPRRLRGRALPRQLRDLVDASAGGPTQEGVGSGFGVEIPVRLEQGTYRANPRRTAVVGRPGVSAPKNQGETWFGCWTA